MEAVGLRTAQLEVAEAYKKAVAGCVRLTGELKTRRMVRGGVTVYEVQVASMEDRCQLLNRFAMRFPEGAFFDLLGGDEAAAAFLSGVFLACGSLADPNKTYRLEFSAPRPELCATLTRLLGEVGFTPRLSHRRGLPILYFRESEQIEDLLTFMACPKVSLEIMDIKILKDRRNAANRAFNCDNANIDKVVGAAAAQIQDIRLLIDRNRLAELPEELRAIARLRLENPEDSLRDLGRRLNPPLTRSGVNHRLEKLTLLAKQCRETD